MSRSAEDVMAAVAQSLAAAGARDRARWVGLFAPDGRVEDPVGSRPHVGHEQIGRFFDTFIGPRQITFADNVDFVSGATVVRDLTLQVQMSPAVAMTIPAILRYTVSDTDEQLKINDLQAYWELPAMMAQFCRHGAAAGPAGIALMRALWSNQKIAGSLGFLRGFRRPGARERTVLTELLTAVSVGDELATRRSLGPVAAKSVDTAELAARLRGASWSKVIAAGTAVAASVHTSSGRAVVIADFAHGTTIERLQLFA